MITDSLDAGLDSKELLHRKILAGREGSCLVLSMRHLGDAVICSGFINSLQQRNPLMAIDVLGRPELEEVIASFSSFREYIGVNLPVFGHHARNIAAIMAAFQAIRMVRKRRYDYCINCTGDVRENIIGRLSGARLNVAPIWEPGHLFRRKMTDTGAAWMVSLGVLIPAVYTSYYKSMEYLANELGLSGLVWKAMSNSKKLRKRKMTVALHPGASHPSRHWPNDRWKDLMRELHSHGYNIRILGAPSERDGLLKAFSEEVADCGIEIFTEDMPGLLLCLSEADVLIGMDSFSVHAAYALGVPVVVLNGSADPSIMTPPGGFVTSAGHFCKKFPCYYEYPCKGTEKEYICVQGIEVREVMSAFEAIIKHVRITR